MTDQNMHNLASCWRSEASPVKAKAGPVSVLRKSFVRETVGSKARTRNLVHGLWNSDRQHCCSCFRQLHNDLMFSILSHLCMADLCAASAVCRRWRCLASHDQLWKRIDATDFVQNVHHCLERQQPEMAAQRTSKILISRIQQYKPVSLSISFIQHRLSADFFLPSLGGLQELTLSGFSDLTDTHVHIMLLSSSFQDDRICSSRGCELRKLVLDECPLLTDATVRNVTTLCPKMENLSLRGNRNIAKQSVKKLPNLDFNPTRGEGAITKPETVGEVATSDTAEATNTSNIFMQPSIFAPLPPQSLPSMFAPPPVAPCMFTLSPQSSSSSLHQSKPPLTFLQSQPLLSREFLEVAPMSSSWQSYCPSPLQSSNSAAMANSTSSGALLAIPPEARLERSTSKQ